jgi:hypothetical protein
VCVCVGLGSPDSEKALHFDKAQAKIRCDSAYGDVHDHHASAVAHCVSVVPILRSELVPRCVYAHALDELCWSTLELEVIVFVDAQADVAILHVTNLVEKLQRENK